MTTLFNVGITLAHIYEIKLQGVTANSSM